MFSFLEIFEIRENDVMIFKINELYYLKQNTE